MLIKALSTSRRCQRWARRLMGLGTDQSGVSAIEFAFVMPVLIGLGMYGTELAYLANTKMQLSQLASSVADNASRLGQTDNSAVVPSISEGEVDALLIGAREQGSRINFEANGRLILTSLERHDSGAQWIHWQRCMGAYDRNSAYGNEDNLNGLSGPPIEGMGRDGEVQAPAGSAIMYVEVYLDHKNLFGDLFFDQPLLRQDAAFLVRDGRNLRQNADKGLSGTDVNSEC